jgi:hypothetical protein
VDRGLLTHPPPEGRLVLPDFGSLREAAVSVHVLVLGDMFPARLGEHQGGQTLGCMLRVCLVFKKLPGCLQKRLGPSVFPAAMGWALPMGDAISLSS